MKPFNYKDYQGNVKVSVEDNCLHEKIEFINDLVNYEAETIDQLEKNSGWPWIVIWITCKQTGMKPKKPL